VVAAVAASHHPPSVTTTTVVPTTVTTTAGSTPPTTVTPSGLTALAQLLPHDVDPAADCTPNQSPPNVTGLTSALICSPKNLPGGQIFAFQFDTPADYTASLAALNKFKGFDPATAGSTCPPGANPQDSIGWHSNTFPSVAGQILECLSVGTSNSQPDYIWTYPSNNVVIDAQAAAHSSFTDLDNWWTKDAPPP
jgi:hypothetical protein